MVMPLAGMDEVGLRLVMCVCVCVFSDTCTGENCFSSQWNFLKGKKKKGGGETMSLDLDIFSFRHPKGIFSQLLNSSQVQ